MAKNFKIEPQTQQMLTRITKNSHKKEKMSRKSCYKLEDCPCVINKTSPKIKPPHAPKWSQNAPKRIFKI